jgi:hypothetical protein
MLEGQQATHVPETPAPVRTCAWCDGHASTTLEVEPAKHTFKRGPNGERVKLIKRAAIEVPVCQHHFRTLERSRHEG